MNGAEEKTDREAIQLHSGDGERQVLVTPTDEDRFVLSCGQAIEACKDKISKKVWLDELDGLFVHVRQWCNDHADLVDACFAAPREGRVVFFFSPKSHSFDLGLSNKLTELDIEIAQGYQVIPTEVLQVPAHTPEGYEAFVDGDKATVIHGQPPESH